VITANETTLKNDAWVRVDGLFNLATIHDKHVSTILADRVLAISTPPPENRYLFF
jgi:uncharacterized membrane protein YcgQ (UPF0703/DUF1980 family)